MYANVAKTNNELKKKDSGYAIIVSVMLKLILYATIATYQALTINLFKRTFNYDCILHNYSI